MCESGFISKPCMAGTTTSNYLWRERLGLPSTYVAFISSASYLKQKCAIIAVTMFNCLKIVGSYACINILLLLMTLGVYCGCI